jgi:hypothetical protein
MPETDHRSAPASVRSTARRPGPEGLREPGVLGRPDDGYPSRRARALPVVVACLMLLAMLYLYSGWHR